MTNTLYNFAAVTLFILSVSFTSCQNNSKSYSLSLQDSSERSSALSLPLSYRNMETEGFIIGEQIALLDDSLQATDTLSAEGKLVKISGISEQLYPFTANDTSICNKYAYVRIQIQDQQAIINGKYIYSATSEEAPKEIQIEKDKYSFVRLENYNALSDTSSNCDLHTPLLFSNSGDNYKGLLKLVNNDIYQSEYPYLELMANAIAHDVITEINTKEDQLILNIRRTGKQSLANMVIVIKKDALNGYSAEVKSIENIR
ncbi:hypothetical protein ACR79M_00670 [Sphingobacterium spiritivorum]|uniref:hypothetical protein n=2 Tax=Sphingobacterium spiritivorum TaxID=258 RepID=UPI003DA3AD2D